VTERQWLLEEEFSLAGIHALTSRYLDQVGPALLGNWRTARRTSGSEA